MIQAPIVHSTLKPLFSMSQRSRPDRHSPPAARCPFISVVVHDQIVVSSVSTHSEAIRSRPPPSPRRRTEETVGAARADRLGVGGDGGDDDLVVDDDAEEGAALDVRAVAVGS